MSFSSDVKEELSKISNKNKECCKLSELAGYLITNCNIARSNGDFVLKMTTESESAIRRVYNAFRSLYDVTPITNIEKKIEGRDTLLELVVQDKSDLQKIFSNSWINIDVNLHIVIDTNNKIKDNHAYAIVNFKEGFLLGEKREFTQKSDTNSDDLTYFDRYLTDVSFYGEDVKVKHNIYSTGLGIDFVQPRTDIFKSINGDITKQRYKTKDEGYDIENDSPFVYQ